MMNSLVSEDLRSVLVGTSALWAVATVAVFLTIFRSPNRSTSAVRDRVVSLLLIGISFQCLHFMEEYVTGFYERFPAILGLRAWGGDFFVTFNLFWISVWALSAIGVRNNYRPAYFPVWFFALAMAGNGVAHPALAIAAQGYFPGLLTSPMVGILGVILGFRMWKLTSR